MKNWKYIVLITLGLFICSCSNSEEDSSVEAMYFPPNDNSTWETKTITELGWNESQVQPLLDYLQLKNSKSFIVLHNGKIVLEYYFNGHTESTRWYWASAGKTLTTAITGIAEEEGYININNKVSDYTGTGWTNVPLAKENLITCKHLLTMTSGLDDTNDQIDAANLNYLADAGTRWAYHSVFFKLQDVIEEATSQNWDNYFNTKLKNPIGMSGIWLASGSSENVYWSSTRSMARFGLLSLNQGNWNGEQIINSNYFNNSTSTSQSINLAYGYMWWLNGKTSYHLPQTQFEFNGSIIPSGPDDMFMALGKNDQKIYVVPSKKLVIIRMGNAADNETAALSDFDEVLWQKINAVINP
jgi:CubicO group peptidase (beta-lactamase class C family)